AADRHGAARADVRVRGVVRRGDAPRSPAGERGDALIALELPGELALLDPWFLLLVPAALLALAVRSRRARAALPSAATGLLTGLPVTLRQRCRALPAVLQVLGFAALCLALARPVTREV